MVKEKGEICSQILLNQRRLNEMELDSQSLSQVKDGINEKAGKEEVLNGVDEILEEIRRLTGDEYPEVINAKGCGRQKPSLINVKHSVIVDSGSQSASPLQTPAQKSARPRSEHDGDFKLMMGLFMIIVRPKEDH